MIPGMILSVKTSIIILTYNKLEYTQSCIDSIRQYTPRGSYQLIVVDNCSTDGTREWLAEQTDILSIFNEENVGFPKGCNQGMEVATGDNILLLNNDVLVSNQWLTLMNDCLYSADDIGAVGPVTNSAYGDQEIESNYSTLEEMWEFANSFNTNREPDWEQRLKLIGFCMLMKREVVDKVGFLDEIFSPGMCEDSDYSIRIMQAGYRLMLCQNVFIHHFGSTSFGDMPEQRQKLWNRNRALFEEKWGFHTAYHTQPREDLINLMNERDRNKVINVLDIGCACGASLLKVKYQFPQAVLYGIENNKHAAAIAEFVGQISVGDAEHFSYPTGEYDYVLLGDILQQVVDPWTLLKKIQNSLKPDGKILASIPNATHYNVIFSLIKNRVLYGNGQLMDRDTLHLFTLPEIQNLFLEAGFEKIGYKAVQSAMSEDEEKFIKQLSSLGNMDSAEHLSTVKFLIRASRNDDSGSVNSELVDLLARINQDSPAESVLQIIGMINHGTVDVIGIIQAINSMNTDKQLLLNVLANQFFSQGQFNDIVPLLNASLEIDSKHHDTLFNYAFILHQVGADSEALRYLDYIAVKDEQSVGLYEQIMEGLNK